MKQKGGFNLFNIFGLGNIKPVKNKQKKKNKQKNKKTKKNSNLSTLKKTLKSESNLIKVYENYQDISKKFNQDYKEHLKNLITLDNELGMKGLETTFNTYVATKEFKKEKVDESNPFFLKNYLVSKSTNTKAFKKEHLMVQISYLLNKFSHNDQNLIKGFDVVSLKGKNVVIIFRCVDNENYEKIVEISKYYLINLEKLKEIIINLCKQVKKNIGYKFKELSEDYVIKSNKINIPGINNLESNKLNNKFGLNSNKNKKLKQKTNSSNNFSEIKLNSKNKVKNNNSTQISSVKINSVIPLSQLNTNSKSEKISLENSSINSDKYAKVKLFSETSKKKKSKKENSSNSNEISQGFRRLDPKKPLKVEKGLSELIKGIDLKNNNNSSSSSSSSSLSSSSSSNNSSNSNSLNSSNSSNSSKKKRKIKKNK